MPAQYFTGFFPIETHQKLAIFVWIFRCVDFHGRIKTMQSLQKLRTVPPQSFKPRNVIKTGVSVFH